MELEELREEAKRQGIKRAGNMKRETLLKKLGMTDEPIEIEAPVKPEEPIKTEEPKKPEEPPVKLGTLGEGILAHFNVKKQFIEQVRVANGLDRMEYSNLRKAFKCFKGEEFVGWMQMEDILVKGGAK